MASWIFLVFTFFSKVKNNLLSESLIESDPGRTEAWFGAKCQEDATCRRLVGRAWQANLMLGNGDEAVGVANVGSLLQHVIDSS